MKKIILVFSFLFIINNLFSQTVWNWTNGGGDNLFSNSSNWDDGLGGPGNPVAGDDVYFDAAFSSTSGDPCTIDQVVSVANFRIISGYTATITISNGNTITTSGDFEIQGGTITGGNSAVSIGNDFIQSGGAFTKPPASMTVTHDLNISGGSFSNSTGGLTLSHDLIISGGSFTNSTTALTISNDITISGGTLNGSTVSITVNRDFNISSGTFTGSSGNLVIKRHFNQTGGTFTAPTGNTDMQGAGGNFTSSAGTFSHNNGTVRFLSNSQQINNAPGFFNLTLANTAVNSLISYTVTGNPSVANVFNINCGTGASALRNIAIVGTGTVSVTGDITLTSGSTAATTGGTALIEINGAGAQKLGGMSNSKECRLPNIRINKSAGTLTMTYTISVVGSWTYTTGTVAAGTSTVIFYGSSVNGGTMSFNNININNTVTLTGSCNVSGVITLAASSTFITSGQTCTLLSTSGATASIAAIPGTATITGNITMQRFVPSGTAGWGLVGSPVSGNTVSDWDAGIYLACPSGCPDGDAGSSFYSVQYFDETVPTSFSNGYTGVDVTASLSKGMGYAVYLNDGSGGGNTGNLNLSVTGPPNTGNITFTVTYTSPNNTAVSDDGWNLLANPYPSTINLNSGSITRTNIDNTFYVWNADLLSGLGDFATYNLATGGVNMTNLLPSSQGFFIHANASGPSLTMTESVKLSTDYAFMKTSGVNSSLNNVVQLTLDGLGYNTGTYVRFFSNATDNFDSDYDVYKLFSWSPLAPSICSKWNNIYYASNCLPDPTGDVLIPIRVKVGTAGSYKITASDLSQVLPESCIMLYDSYTGTTTDLRASSYTCVMSDTTDAPRFMLKILYNIPLSITSTVKNPSTSVTSDGSVIALPSGTGPWTYKWKNALGNVLKTKSNTTQSDTLKNISAGIFTVEVISSGICGLFPTVQTYTLIGAPSGINEQLYNNGVYAGNDQNGIYVQFLNDTEEDAAISAYNVIGQKVMNDISVKVMPKKTYLQLNGADNQIIFIYVKYPASDKYVVQKIFNSNRN